MGTDQIQYERELFEQYIKGRAPGVNLQKLGAAYIDLDVQLHFETWLARASLAEQRSAGEGCHCATCTCNPNMTPAVRFDLSPAQQDEAIREHLIRLGWTPPDAQQRAEPVATILVPDPADERPGPWMSREAWDRLRALPPGTKLYADY